MERNELLKELKDMIFKLNSVGEQVAIIELGDNLQKIMIAKRTLREVKKEIDTYYRFIDSVQKEIQKKRAKK